MSYSFSKWSSIERGILGMQKTLELFSAQPSRDLRAMTALNYVGYQRWWYSCLSKMRTFYLTFLVWRYWQKNTEHESCELSFLWGKMRTIALEKVIQITLRNCSEELVEAEVSMSVILVKEDTCNQAHTLAECSCQSQKCCYSSWGSDVSIKDSSDCLDRRRWKKLVWWNLPLKISGYLKACSARISQWKRVPYSWPPPWTPFRLCRRSPTAVATDILLAVTGCKCQVLVGSTFSWSQVGP